MEELRVPRDLTASQAKALFLTATKNKLWWGMFEDNNLVSISALNSNNISLALRIGKKSQIKWINLDFLLSKCQEDDNKIKLTAQGAGYAINFIS